MGKDKLIHVNFEGFDLVSSSCRMFYEWGGCAIWAKIGLDVEPLPLEQFSIDKHFEVCGLSYVQKIGNKRENFILLVIYHSPSGNCDTFFAQLYEVLNFVFKSNRKIMICGDFNYDHQRDTKEFNTLCNIFSSFGLLPKVWWPTRVTATSAYIIDNIFCNFSSNISVFDNQISDHRSIFCTLCDDNVAEENNTVLFRRSYSEEAIEAFEEALLYEDWSNLYLFSDLDCAFNFFGVFLSHFNTVFPKRQFYRNNKKKSWINQNVRQSSLLLKSMFQQQKICPNLGQEYKTAKTEHNRLVRITNKNYYQQKIVSSDYITKTTWNVVRSQIRKKLLVIFEY